MQMWRLNICLFYMASLVSASWTFTGLYEKYRETRVSANVVCKTTSEGMFLYDPKLAEGLLALDPSPQQNCDLALWEAHKDSEDMNAWIGSDAYGTILGFKGSVAHLSSLSKSANHNLETNKVSVVGVLKADGSLFNPEAVVRGDFGYSLNTVATSVAEQGLRKLKGPGHKAHVTLPMILDKFPVKVRNDPLRNYLAVQGIMAKKLAVETGTNATLPKWRKTNYCSFEDVPVLSKYKQ